ncbi:alpha/beta fold hydrolase [Patescibacteria group bacterium]|nr:alpha/beta fold hydrolase [Patescibacteria group bacterium]MBU4452748.1 alpha/beta fold hydrolase [Patescibacteria group bacterium]
MKIVLIHGYKASSKTNFFSWLTDQLKKQGHEVVCPDLPNPEAPDPDEWIKTLLEEVGPIDEDTVVVGHSIGGAMALRFLEASEMYSTPHACILISTPWMIKSELFRGFFLSELDFDVLMWKASKFVVIHSKDDPSIPFDHAQKYAEVLHAKLIEADGCGHFLGEQYPIILSTIEDCIKEPVVYAPGEGIADEYEGVE